MDTYREQADALLSELKMTLRIEIDDDDTNLLAMLARSMSRLNTLAGTEVDYVEDLEARELLFNRVRYDYNSALEYWDDNFSQPILAFTLRYGVSAL